jgi:signal peptidase II
LTPQSQQTAADSGISRARSFVRVREHFVFWPLVILGIAFDLWTKKAVFEWLGDTYPPGHVVISGVLNIVVAENTGAAFGIASGQRILLLCVSGAAMVAVIYFFLFGRDRKPLLTISLALFLAGILGNAYDRIFNDGRVRDFIDVIYYKGQHWPAFNVADSLLCIAVFLLLIASFSKTGRRS